MKSKTLTALRGSIRKWEAIIHNGGLDKGTKNCPLCQKFFKNGCYGCPVSHDKEMSGCIGTPYNAWLTHQESSHYRRSIGVNKIKCAECRRIAKRELAYLKRLLPEEKSDDDTV
jgi:hypothetical protein